MNAPQRIGAYPIERELGRGGLGIVSLGRDVRLDRAVAITGGAVIALWRHDGREILPLGLDWPSELSNRRADR